MNLSIITSMYNKDPEVIKLISELFFRSLLNNSSLDYELVIIDDHSPLETETRVMVEKFMPQLKRYFGNVIFKRNPKNLGFAQSYNTGIYMASCKQLLITNDDVYFPQGSIAKLVNTLNETAGYKIVGPVTNANTAWSFQYCQQAPILKSHSNDELEKLGVFAKWLENEMKGRRIITDNLCGFCFAADAEFLKKQGGFDESYKFGLFEDTDLIQRIVHKYGKEKVAINLEVFVNHGGTAGSSKSVKQLPAKMLYYSLINGAKYARSWGWWTLAKRIHYGLLSQITGRGTISEQLPKKINY